MKTRIEKQKEKLENLFRLVKENPNLPIIPLVDSEIVADNYASRWCSSLGESRLDKILITNERFYIYSLDDYDIMEDFIPYHVYINMIDEEVKQAFENLDWIEVIIVDINLPEQTLVGQ